MECMSGQVATGMKVNTAMMREMGMEQWSGRKEATIMKVCMLDHGNKAFSMARER
jgi:hypothetical protein